MASLISATMDAVEHTYNWDGNADGGQRAEAGIYILRLRAGDQIVTQRLTIIR